MSPKDRLRHRMTVVLHMVMAFIIIILLAQLWLFTVVIDAVGDGEISSASIAALLCSLFACLAICGLIRLFLRAEVQQ